MDVLRIHGEQAPAGVGSRLAWRRIGAWCVDWLIISAYAGALVPLGILVFSHRSWSPLAANALGFVLLVVPGTLWMAAWESGSRGASPGKRLLRLRVDAPRRTGLGWARSWIRNGLKIAVPWELGHTAAFVLSDPHASGSGAAVGMTVGVMACLVGFGYVVALFVGSGRTPYDMLSTARVTAARRP